MLLRLLPDQVNDMWDIIRPAIRESLPPFTGEREEVMNKILFAILTEKLICWLSYKKAEKPGGTIKLDGLMTTCFVEDPISATRNILIYTVYGYADVREEAWLEGYDCLIKFGRAHGCVNIIAYTMLDYLKELAEKFQGDSAFNLITVPIGGA